MKSFVLINLLLPALAIAATSMPATTQSAPPPIPTRVTLRLNNVPVGEAAPISFSIRPTC